MRAVHLLIVLLALVVRPAAAEVSIARVWNEEALDAIRIDTPRPPVHARNLFHLSVAMHDVWAAFDPAAHGYLFTEKIDPPPTNVAAARHEAISYAAYRVLRARYARSASSNQTFAALVQRMDTLGYPTNLVGESGSAPSAVGNRAAAQVLAATLHDGANELNNYRQNIGYFPVNDVLFVEAPGVSIDDPNRWQPLAFDFAETQNGLEALLTQTFVGPHWGRVTPFALLRTATNRVYEEMGPPPRFFEADEARLKAEMVEVLAFASLLDPADGVWMDASPGSIGQNGLGRNDGTGHALNPHTGQPYASNTVRRADWGRILAEYWADGPDSETPPGHWNSIANAASDALTNKLIGGTTPVADDLEWDVKLYLGLNGALHDAAVAAWNHKGVYDSVRPISAIRWMAQNGQCTDSNLPSYSAQGLPLVSGLVELVTAQTAQAGQRHAQFFTNLGEIVVRVWPGQPADPTNQVGGVVWTRGVSWVPYQKRSFVTPPFAGYVSGHSTFSRSAAEFLTAFTGDPFVPGGLGEYFAPAGSTLSFEYGPESDTRVQWATYRDAADLAGISRLWGGIHIASDDLKGRIIGARIGQAAWHYLVQFLAGESAPHPLVAAETAWVDGRMEITWPTRSGRVYRVERSTNGVDYAAVAGPFTAGGTSLTWTNTTPEDASAFHRVVAGE